MDRRSWMGTALAGCLVPFLRFAPQPRPTLAPQPTPADKPPKGWTIACRARMGKDDCVIFESPDHKKCRWYINGRFDCETDIKR